MISFVFNFFLGKIFSNKSLFVKILFESLSIFFTITLIYYAGQSYALTNSESSQTLFVFLLVGEISLIMPMSFAERLITHFLEIRNQQFYQTLLGLRISPTRFVLSRAMADAVFPFFRIITIISFCTLFLSFHFTIFNFLAFWLLQFFAIMLFTFMALITTLIYLKFNRGIGFFYSLQSIAAIIGGLYFPIKIFPGYLKSVSIILPQTQILMASRLIFQSQALEVNTYITLLVWFVLLSGSWLILDKYLITWLKQKARFF